MAVVADELLLIVKSNVTQALAGLEAVEQKAGGLGGKVKKGVKLAAAAVAGIGIAAVGVGVVSAKLAVDFGRDMAQIEALVGVPKDEMDVLRAAALRMGSDFGVSAGEAAAGLFFLKSAGLETSDAIAALESSAMASAIGLGAMEDLANTATTAMTNFGLDSTEAFDTIATAAKLAKADPAALGKIMNENSASAALVGMRYDDMAGTLALLTRKFGDANAAGTGMGGILRKLVKPSAMATDMLDGIGVSAAEFQELLANDLPYGLRVLDDAFADSGVSQSEWIGKVFEDGEAIKAAAAIIGTESEEIAEVFSGIHNSAGALQEGWTVMEETASVKFAKMKEGIMSALIPVGEVILTHAIPAIEAFVRVDTEGRGVVERPAQRKLRHDHWHGWFLRLGHRRRGDSPSLVGRKFWGNRCDARSGRVLNPSNLGRNLDLPGAGRHRHPGPHRHDRRHHPGILGRQLRPHPRLHPARAGHHSTCLVSCRFGMRSRVTSCRSGTPSAASSRGPSDVINGPGIIQTVMAIVTGDWDKAWEGIKSILSGVWEILIGIVVGAWELLQTADGTWVSQR